MQPEINYVIYMFADHCIKRVRRELMVKATLNVPDYYKDSVAWLLIFVVCQKQQMYDGNNGLLKAMTEQT